MSEIIYPQGANLDAETMARTSKFFELVADYRRADLDNVLADLVREGVCVNAADKQGRSPLYMVLLKDWPLTFGLLLDKGADVNAVSGMETPLLTVIRHGIRSPAQRSWFEKRSAMLKKAEMLISRKADVNWAHVQEIPSKDTRPEHKKEVHSSNALETAYAARWCEAIRLLIDNGANIEKIRWNEMDVAAMRGDVGRIRELLPLELNENTKRASLDVAVMYEQIGAMEALLENTKTDDRWHSALKTAVQHGKLRAVRLLIENGADVNEGSRTGLSPIHSVANLLRDEDSRPKEVIKVLVENGANIDAEYFDKTALYEAVGNNDSEVIQALIDCGAKVNIGKGDSPMHKAAGESSISTMELLIANGGDVRLEGLLHNAIRESNFEMLQYLIDRGAPVNVEDGRIKSPLHVAAEYDKPEAVHILLRAGAEINARDENGETPLHSFIRSKHRKGIKFEAMQVLIKSGADIEARSNNGETPLHAAMLVSMQTEIIRLLIKYGANIYVHDVDRNLASQHDVYNKGVKEVYNNFRISKKPPEAVQEIYDIMAAMPQENPDMGAERERMLRKIFIHANWESREQAETMLQVFLKNSSCGVRGFVEREIMEKVSFLRGWSGNKAGVGC